MIEKIKQMHDLIVQLSSEGIIGVSFSSYCNKEFQMDNECFFEKFTDFESRKRNGKDYPYESFVGIDGLKIYTILTEKDYKKYVLKGAI